MVNAVKNLATDMQDAFALHPARSDRVECTEKWMKPEEGWCKLNTDGSVFVPEKSAASAGLLRDHQGSWILGFSGKLGDHTITMAELLGLREGLSLAWDRRILKIEIEVDSEVIVNLVKSADIDTHPMGNLINDCRELMHRPWDIRFKHVRQDCNHSADVLAKMGHCLASNFDFWLESPIEVVECVISDSIS